MSPPNRLARRAAVRPSPVLIEPKAKSTDVLGWAIPAYLLLLSGGFALLRSPIATVRGNELSIDRAAFTAVNAVTLTGFGQTIGVDELRPPGQFCVFVLMTGGTALSLIVGGQLVTRIIGLPFSNRRIYSAAAIAVGVAMLFGAASLGDTVLHGAFTGVSALGNCGLCIGKPPGPEDLSTLIVLLPLAVAGGLGIPIWLEIIASYHKRSAILYHGLISLSIYGGVYIVGMGLLWTQLATDKTLSSALATCSAYAIASRSAGFSLGPIDQFTRGGQWILAGLMVVGSVSGGTGGGLKGTTLFVFFRGLRRSYSEERTGRGIVLAAAWMASYLLLVFVGFVTLLELVPQMPGDRVLFLTISAASNVGWSHDPVSIVKSGLAVLLSIMLLGRLFPILVLWWMSKSAAGSDIAVG